MSVSRDGSPASPHQRLSLKVPACDTCRSRKVRCDRGSPCSSCKALQTVCRTTKKEPEKRNRVLLSTKYLTEVSDIKDKLETLSKSISRNNGADAILSAAPGPSTYEHPTGVAPSVAHTPSSLTGTTLAWSPFEGESSFLTQTDHLNQALGSRIENAVTPSSGNIAAPTIVPVQDSTTFTAGDTPAWPELWPSLGIARMPLPAMDVALKIMRLAKFSRQKVLDDFLFLDLGELVSLCQRFYFPTDDYTVADFLTLNAALFLFISDLDESSASQWQIGSAELTRDLELCRANLSTVARCLRMNMNPTIDNIQALVLTVSVLLEDDHFELASNLLTMTCRLCQDKGLHRLSAAGDTTQIRKESLLFWMAYNLDHGVAFNLGRAPNLQDFDISTPEPYCSGELNSHNEASLLGWVHFARLQSNIYEQLYSAAAQGAPKAIREERAEQLAARILGLQSQFSYPTSRESKAMGTMFIQSLLTSIYRIIPPAEHVADPLKFSERCLTSARLALTTLTAAWAETGYSKDRKWASFLHWTVKFPPFTPFVVILSNIMAERNRADLNLVVDTVAAMSGPAEYSRAIKKVHDTCLRFSQLAQAYMDQGTRTSASQQQQEGVVDASADRAVGSDVQSAEAVAGWGPEMWDFEGLSNSGVLWETLDLPLFRQDWGAVFDSLAGE